MTMRKTFLATALMLAVWLFLQPGSAQRALAQDDGSLIRGVNFDGSRGRDHLGDSLDAGR